MILREQLVNSSSRDLQVWLKERQPKSADEMIELAEAYQNAHRGSTNRVQTNNKGKFRDQQTQETKGEKTCYKCHRTGHFVNNCPLRKSTDKDFKSGQQWGEKSKAGNPYNGKDKAGLIHSPTIKRKGLCLELPVNAVSKCLSYREKGNGLNIENGMVNGESVSVLRDTGCTAILVADKFIKRHDLTGGVREVTLANGCLEKCPEVWIEVDTPYVKGKVVALVMNTPFADLIVGNYTRVDIPVKKESSSVGKEDEKCQAVETRSTSKKRKVEEEVLDGYDFGKDFSKEDWIAEQQKDPTLEVYRKRVMDKIPEGEKKFISMERGMLYRNFRSSTEDIMKQLVVPAKFRRQILSLGHDIPMAGHLGMKKTRDRIMRHFFWPGIFDDTKKYCRSCPKCQKGTSKTKVSKVPLVQIPRIDEPFQRIAMDMVGPLPRTKRGNQYVLVICDYATKYPEAIPLRSQEAEVVAGAMVEVFSRVSVPKEILSDQGTNFMSSLISELCRLLSIRKLSTTSHLPQANGLVERFNGTLKQMLQIFAQNEPGKWDN